MTFTHEDVTLLRTVRETLQGVLTEKRARGEAEQQRDVAQQEVERNRKRLEVLVSSPTVAAARNTPLPARQYER